MLACASRHLFSRSAVPLHRCRLAPLRPFGEPETPAAIIAGRRRARFLIARASSRSRSFPPNPTHTARPASSLAPAANMSIEKIKVANPVVDLDGDEMTRCVTLHWYSVARFSLARRRRHTLHALTHPEQQQPPLPLQNTPTHKTASSGR